MLRFHSRVVYSLRLRLHSPLRSYLSLCSNYVRFMSRCSIPLASFSPCLASRRSFHSARSFIPFALLTSFHCTSLHSTPSAPLVACFDFITFLISPFRYRERYERKRSDWSRRRKEQSDASLGTERGSGMKHMSGTKMKWRFNECAKWNDIATFSW